jgi:osmotically-inducible protein OsmY
MNTNEKIKQDIKAELEWGSRLNGSSITSEVNNGIVTLSGYIDSYPKKTNIIKAIERIENVISVISFLEVRLPLVSYRTDSDIERSVQATIKWNTSIDDSHIICRVQNGVVILEGYVEWEYQRTKAALLAGDITGVTDVKNHININSYSTGLNTQRINSGLHKSSQRPRPGYL